MTQNSTSSWTDRDGRLWSCAITVNELRRVKELTKVDLADAFGGELLIRLSSDPVLLVDVLYAVCQPQAEARNVTDEAFGALLVGDTIDAAASALIQGLIDFFPRARRQVLAGLWEKTQQTQAAGLAMATQKLDSPLVTKAVEAAIQQASDEIDRQLSEFGNASGNLPASSVSTPDR